MYEGFVNNRSAIINISQSSFTELLPLSGGIGLQKIFIGKRDSSNKKHIDKETLKTIDCAAEYCVAEKEPLPNLKGWPAGYNEKKVQVHRRTVHGRT